MKVWVRKCQNYQGELREEKVGEPYWIASRDRDDTFTSTGKTKQQAKTSYIKKIKRRRAEEKENYEKTIKWYNKVLDNLVFTDTYR